ncbi:NUDIX hydrolase, partial [Micromonospora chalcea]
MPDTDLTTYADLHADAVAALSRWTATSPAAGAARDRTLA